MAHSSKPKRAAKAGKPHPNFPLFVHQSGRWAKKVKGRLVYFGSTKADPQGAAALERWLFEKDYLLAGKTPPPSADDCVTLRVLCNHFLTSKQAQMEAGELTKNCFDDYHRLCARMIKFFGKDTVVDQLTPADFRRYRLHLAKAPSAVTLRNAITRARVVFNFGYASELLSRPPRYGKEFSRPANRLIVLQKAERGQRYCDRTELRALIDAARTPLKAMLLLGINCGLGNREVGMLRFRNLDLDQGWLNYLRNKTGMNRRAKLWPETIAAIEQAIQRRPTPTDEAHGELVFVTKYGQPWCKATSDSPIANEFAKLADDLGLQRPGLSFYSLRHTTETIGGGCRDQVAVDFVMGHAPRASDMAAIYRHHIDDDRLVAVADHIHTWLYAGDDRDDEAPATVKFRKAK